MHASSNESQCQDDGATPMNTTGDLEGYAPTEIYIKLSKTCNGEHAHEKYGTHLDGEIDEH